MRRLIHMREQTCAHHRSKVRDVAALVDWAHDFELVIKTRLDSRNADPDPGHTCGA